MDVTAKILGVNSPYIKSMKYIPEQSKYVLALWNSPVEQKEYTIITFPQVTECKVEQHAPEENDCLDDIIGIVKPEDNCYIITTQSFEVFLKCEPPIS